MRVLVTGAAGFLGLEVCETLKSAGMEVLPVDIAHHENSLTIDVRSRNFENYVLSESPDVIVHLAGTQYLKRVKVKDRESLFKQNIDMAESISKAIQDSKSITQVVFVSTDMVYGRVNQSPVPVSEPTKPIGPYGLSKLLAESIIKETTSKNNVSLVIFRPRLIAGQGRLGTIAKLKSLVLNNLPVPIFGQGNNRYQLISKEDVARAILSSVVRKVSGTFNLGSDNPPRVKALIESVIKHNNSRSSVIKLPYRTSIRLLRLLDRLNLSPLSPEQFEIAGLDYVLDTTETKEMLGWQPTKNDAQILFESIS